MELILSLNSSQDEDKTISKIFEISAGNNFTKSSLNKAKNGSAKIIGEKRSSKPFTLKLEYEAINDSNNIQIFGAKFVKNNRNRCKIIRKNKQTI